MFHIRLAAFVAAEAQRALDDVLSGREVIDFFFFFFFKLAHCRTPGATLILRPIIISEFALL